METTTNSRSYINQQATGYMVNTLLSDSSQRSIKKIQDAFAQELPESIWATPANALHMTLLDWLAPLVDYGRNKDAIFDDIYREYNGALSEILSNIRPIDLTFEKLIISPAAIAVVADSKGTDTFNKIRQDFLGRINLLPNTKQPPTIAHCTIARFIKEININDVRHVADSLDLSFHESIREFQLVRETRLPMLEYAVIARYHL